MADNIEIRLDQLTEAIKGLYAKSSMSQGEIYNALTSLSQRYENLTNVSGEKIASTLIEEFRKTLEQKYSQTSRSLKDLEVSLNNFMMNNTAQNPKVNAEINKILNDTANIYSKLNAQDLALERIFNLAQNNKSGDGYLEITKLSENFMNFSQGFKNITDTLNKNFADFLGQIKKTNAKDDVLEVKSQIGTVVDNINSVKSQVAVIDAKYQDLTSLIDSIAHRENIFHDAVQEIKNLSNTINSSKNNNQQDISKDISSTKIEISNMSSSIQNLNGEVKNIRVLLNDDVLKRARQNAQDYEKYLKIIQDDIKNLMTGLNSFKSDLNDINRGNIKILQEPVERALDELKNQDLGKTLKEMSDNLKNVTSEIQSSVKNLETSLSGVNTNSTIQMLTQISESIPNISDKLEIFRNHVVSENSANLARLKSDFSETVLSFQESLENALAKINDGAKNSNTEIVDGLKIDLQKLSDYFADNVDVLKDRLQDSLSVIETQLEDYRRETVQKIDNTINSNIINTQDNLNVLKSDILDAFQNVDKSREESLSQFESKIDSLLINCVGANNDESLGSKSLKDAVIEMDSKIERANLQQIHNAKELLEEIQASVLTITTKISGIEENKSITSVIGALQRLNDKIQEMQEFNLDLSEELRDTKSQIDIKLKENIQKISSLVQKPSDSQAEDKSSADIDNLANKVQEYLSNFEYLKNNISQEIKENLEGEFLKLEKAIIKIRSNSENSDYSYNLEDIESDLAKIKLTIEKNTASSQEMKTLQEKIAELRTVGLENVKLNRDIESELGNLSGWCKDAVDKLDDVSNRLDELQNNAFEDIKTRLVQSEKSKSNLMEFSSKIENALKYLVKNSQAQEAKINELTKKLDAVSTAQAENFNPSQLIDIFYENMTQTKMLTNRVEIIEDKINNIQTAITQLMSYVEN